VAGDALERARRGPGGAFGVLLGLVAALLGVGEVVLRLLEPPPSGALGALGVRRCGVRRVAVGDRAHVGHADRAVDPALGGGDVVARLRLRSERRLDVAVRVVDAALGVACVGDRLAGVRLRLLELLGERARRLGARGHGLGPAVDGAPIGDDRAAERRGGRALPLRDEARDGLQVGTRAVEAAGDAGEGLGGFADRPWLALGDGDPCGRLRHLSLPGSRTRRRSGRRRRSC
jgi:hypothetical protein